MTEQTLEKVIRLLRGVVNALEQELKLKRKGASTTANT